MDSSVLNDDLALKTLRWCLVLAGFLFLVFRHRSLVDQVGLVREMALVIFAYFAYFAVRGATVGSEARALANADRVVSIERSLGIFREPGMQSVILEHGWLVDLMNWMYIWGHWPLIILVAVWLYFNWPATYRLYRNAFLISGAIGLVIFTIFPVAPPRLADVDIIDTVTLHSRSYRVLQPPGLVNQYAAVPSLHFGWNLLIGMIFFTQGRSLMARSLGIAIPIVMFLAIVLTANHYIIDAAAGAVVALTGLMIATMLGYDALSEQATWREHG